GEDHPGQQHVPGHAEMVHHRPGGQEHGDEGGWEGPVVAAAQPLPRRHRLRPLLPRRPGDIRRLDGGAGGHVLAGPYRDPFSDSSAWCGACRAEFARSPTVMLTRVDRFASASPSAIAAACKCSPALATGSVISGP